MRRSRNRCPFDGKAVYRSYDLAAKAAARLPVPGRPYWCAHAGGWHQTHVEKSEYQRRRSRT